MARPLAHPARFPRAARALAACALAAACLACLAGCAVSSTETSTWDGSADTSWYEPGRASYDLTSAAQLAGLAQLVDEGERFEGATVNLKVNVNLDGLDWNPIGGIPGQNEGTFCGTFDGNGNTIAGLHVVSQLSNQALIASMHGGRVCNMVVRGEVMGREMAAGVVSSAIDTEFSNVVSDVDVFSTNFYDNTNTGGMVGNLVLTEAGRVFEVADCLNNGRVRANDWAVGGLVGSLACAEGVTVNVRNCTNQGYVSVDALSKEPDQAIGGLVGESGGVGTYNFEGCANLADVYTTEVVCVGGLVGHADGADTHFRNCRNAGDLSTDSLNDIAIVGGIMGTYGLAGFTMEGCANEGELHAFHGSTYDLARGAEAAS